MAECVPNGTSSTLMADAALSGAEALLASRATQWGPSATTAELEAATDALRRVSKGEPLWTACKRTTWLCEESLRSEDPVRCA
eukprot:2428479-Amphidinium_carterae.2